MLLKYFKFTWTYSKHGLGVQYQTLISPEPPYSPWSVGIMVSGVESILSFLLIFRHHIILKTLLCPWAHSTDFVEAASLYMGIPLAFLLCMANISITEAQFRTQCGLAHEVLKFLAFFSRLLPILDVLKGHQSNNPKELL